MKLILSCKGVIPTTNQEKIADCRYKIQNYEHMLKIMPEDTFLGRLCIEAYLKKEKRKLSLMLELEEVKGK